MSIENLCTQIEADDLRIKEIKIKFDITDDQYAVVRFNLDPSHEVARNYRDEFPQGELTYRDLNFDVNIWRRLGRAIRNSTSLRRFILKRSVRFRAIHFSGEARACVAVLLDEIKYNSSIQNLYLFLFPSEYVPMFSLDQILRNSRRGHGLDDITLESGLPLSLDQSRVIAAGLGGSLLGHVKLLQCRFEDEGTFQQVIQACTGVKYLEIHCNTVIQYATVASLLQDPRAMLENIDIPGPGSFNDQDEIAAGKEIIAGLLDGNSKLKRACIDLNIMDEDLEQELANHFRKLVCDSTSIEGIINSNHTLESLNLGVQPLSSRAKECLKFNQIPDENRVIRNKMMQYYFLDNFDPTPFVSMPISVQARILSLGKETSNQNTAILGLLRSIPELCDVSGRCDEQSSNYKTRNRSLCAKRQKVDG
eukprot:scaffold20185_cov38-Cyclotella_meneghiniana.AAC.1